MSARIDSRVTLGSVIATLGRLAIWSASKRYAADPGRRLRPEQAMVKARPVTYGVTVLAALLATGCAQMAVATPRPVNAPAPTQAPAAVTASLYQPDDVITVTRDGEAWSEVSVTQVNMQPTYRSASGYVDSAASGSTYIAMFVTYKAVAQNVIYSLFDWQLYVDDLAISTFAAVLSGPKPALSAGTLSAGRRAEGWLVYEIPIAGRVLLSYGANPFSNQPPIFEVELRPE